MNSVVDVSNPLVFVPFGFISLLTGLFFYKLVQYCFNYSKAKELMRHIPGDVQLLQPAFGSIMPGFMIHAIQMKYYHKERLFTYLTDILSKEKSKIVKLVIGSFRVIASDDPDFLKMMVTKASKNFSKKNLPFNDFLNSTFGENVFSTFEEMTWRRHRTLLNHAFEDQNLGCVCDATKEALRNFHAHVGNKDLRNALEDFSNITLDVIGLAGFGYHFNSFENVGDGSSLSRKSSLLLSDFALYQLSPALLKKIPFGPLHQMETAIQGLQRVIRDIIDHRKSKPNAESNDLLNIMMSNTDMNQDSEHAPFSISELLSNTFIFLIAGHETTARTLVFTSYLLATNPHIQEKARKFVLDVLGDKEFTYEDYEKLWYIEDIIKESLRLYPVATGLARRNLQEFEFKGHKIPEGCACIMLFPPVHRDADYWDRPDDFIPERWREEKMKEKLSKTTFMYVPFGIGKRSCIGRKFAMIESVFVIADILRKYKIHLVDEQNYGKMEVDVSVTSRPRKPVFLKYEKLHSA